jgi:16S rRNA (cytosine967-C5)-methyltransferase
MGLIPAAEPTGLPARRIAADILHNVLYRRRPLDEQLHDRESDNHVVSLSERDRALVRALVGTVLRHLGTLRHLLNQLLDRGIPRQANRVEIALLIGAAQIIWLDVPDHAAVDLAVRLVQGNPAGPRYAGLINAVLRRFIREKDKRLAGLDSASLDTPPWLMARWMRHYGEQTARAIALANGKEAPLDLTVKQDAQHWAARLGGHVLPNGSIRLPMHGPIAQMPGYAQGEWWVQDAAAAMPVRLLGDIAGRAVADLGAAPGGKTAQLAAAGARVAAVERAAARLDRLKGNLARLRLNAELVLADALSWRAGPFDAVLLDAPCSSTGTIRRHPDIPWIKREADIAELASVQKRLLAHASTLVKSGGILAYCACSLEPEEGDEIVNDFLAGSGSFRRRPIRLEEVFDCGEWLTPQGDLRTLPCHLADPAAGLPGLDGFYVARLERF